MTPQQAATVTQNTMSGHTQQSAQQQQPQQQQPPPLLMQPMQSMLATPQAPQSLWPMMPPSSQQQQHQLGGGPSSFSFPQPANFASGLFSSLPMQQPMQHSMQQPMPQMQQQPMYSIQGMQGNTQGNAPQSFPSLNGSGGGMMPPQNSNGMQQLTSQPGMLMQSANSNFGPLSSMQQQPQQQQFPSSMINGGGINSGGIGGGMSGFGPTNSNFTANGFSNGLSNGISNGNNFGPSNNLSNFQSSFQPSNLNTGSFTGQQQTNLNSNFGGQLAGLNNQLGPLPPLGLSNPMNLSGGGGMNGINGMAMNGGMNGINGMNGLGMNGQISGPINGMGLGGLNSGINGGLNTGLGGLSASLGSINGGGNGLGLNAGNMTALANMGTGSGAMGNLQPFQQAVLARQQYDLLTNSAQQLQAQATQLQQQHLSNGTWIPGPSPQPLQSQMMADLSFTNQSNQLNLLQQQQQQSLFSVSPSLSPYLFNGGMLTPTNSFLSVPLKTVLVPLSPAPPASAAHNIAASSASSTPKPKSKQNAAKLLQQQQQQQQDQQDSTSTNAKRPSRVLASSPSSSPTVTVAKSLSQLMHLATSEGHARLIKQEASTREGQSSKRESVGEAAARKRKDRAGGNDSDNEVTEPAPRSSQQPQQQGPSAKARKTSLSYRKRREDDEEDDPAELEDSKAAAAAGDEMIEMRLDSSAAAATGTGAEDDEEQSEHEETNDGDDEELHSPSSARIPSLLKRSELACGSIRTAPGTKAHKFRSVIRCGVVDRHGNTQSNMHQAYFGREMDVYTAEVDPKRRPLVRASTLADKFSCATNKIGMYLARRRTVFDGIYQATEFANKPAGKTGLKIGGYFLTLDACADFERHYWEHKQKKGDGSHTPQPTMQQQQRTPTPSQRAKQQQLQQQQAYSDDEQPGGASEEGEGEPIVAAPAAATPTRRAAARTRKPAALSPSSAAAAASAVAAISSVAAAAKHEPLPLVGPTFPRSTSSSSVAVMPASPAAAAPGDTLDSLHLTVEVQPAASGGGSNGGGGGASPSVHKLSTLLAPPGMPDRVSPRATPPSLTLAVQLANRVSPPGVIDVLSSLSPASRLARMGAAGSSQHGPDLPPFSSKMIAVRTPIAPTALPASSFFRSSLAHTPTPPPFQHTPPLTTITTTTITTTTTNNGVSTC